MSLNQVSTGGTASASEFVQQITDARTAQSFEDTPVDQADLEAILQAGLAATSAINTQPWHFAVVTDKEVMNEIVGGEGMPAGAPPQASEGSGEGQAPEGEAMPAAPPSSGTAKATLGDSPVAIIVYVDESTASPNPMFDCGLACQNMVVAANALGYCAKIVSSPIMSLNGDRHDELCEMLGVSSDYSAVAVLLLGHSAESADAVSSASIRSTIEEKISFTE